MVATAVHLPLGDSCSARVQHSLFGANFPAVVLALLNKWKRAVAFADLQRTELPESSDRTLPRGFDVEFMTGWAHSLSKPTMEELLFYFTAAVGACLDSG